MGSDICPHIHCPGCGYVMIERYHEWHWDRFWDSKGEPCEVDYCPGCGKGWRLNRETHTWEEVTEEGQETGKEVVAQ